MKLKYEYGVEILINENGLITLIQDDDINEEVNIIFLSPQQFKKLTIWFDVNEKEIEKNWNDGFIFNDDKKENNNEEKNDEIKKNSK